MEFAGFGHITLTVANFDACVAFYDRVMRQVGMRRYISFPPHAVGWFAGEYMFVIGKAAPDGDRFSQARVGLHHLSFRARSRDEVDAFDAMLREIGAKITSPADSGPFWPGYYSVVCEDPDGTRIEMNYIPPEGWQAVAEVADTIEKTGTDPRFGTR
jgi:catechol 2,3-dioxygenase-like lactoylglutathione lyase family enzyme